MYHAIRNVYFLVPILFLLGCQTTGTSPYAGSGPISLSRSAEFKFHATRTYDGYHIFAVSPDGQHIGWSGCSDHSGLCAGDVTQTALRNCKQESGGVDCKVFAENGIIVWKGAENEGKKFKKVVVEVGQGPIEFNYTVEQAWENYLSLEDPLFFSVTKDGTGYGAIKCNVSPCVRAERSTSIDTCQRKTGEKCYLYADGRNIVWKTTQRSKQTKNNAHSVDRKSDNLSVSDFDPATLIDLMNPPTAQYRTPLMKKVDNVEPQLKNIEDKCIEYGFSRNSKKYRSCVMNIIKYDTSVRHTEPETVSTFKGPKYMTAKEMANAFKKGSIYCNNVLADGTKVQDFYYKDKTKWSGNLDRNISSYTNIGDKIGTQIKRGEWKIMGPGLRIKIGEKKKPYGKWFNLTKTGRKSYVAYDSAGKKYMTMKCR